MYKLRYTEEFKEDIKRLYQFILNRDNSDWDLAEKVLEDIDKCLKQLAYFPYNFRKVEAHNPYIREIIIPFGSSGYVARYEIEPHNIITIIAVKHQLENDYN